MPYSSIERSPQTIARIAGLLYLVIIVLGVWSELFVRSALIVPDDAAATAANILASEGLFRASFAADSVMALCDVALAILLYVLLRPVSPTLALLAAVFRLVQATVISVSLLSLYAALLVLNGAGLEALSGDELNALALLFLDAHSQGYDLGLIFFGVNSLLVGYLLYESTYFPRVLGILMAAAGLVYLAGSYLRFLAPAASEPFAPAYLVPLIAETAFCLWLIVKGVNVEKWDERAGRGI